MKEKTSITLSGDVLTAIDRLAGSKQSRSAFIERVLRQFLRQRARAAVQARDLERINAAAQRLNAEAADVMEYQAAKPNDSWGIHVKRGELYRVHKPAGHPKQYRTFVIVSRQIPHRFPVLNRRLRCRVHSVGGRT